MILSEFIILMVTIAGLFIWNRAEGRADARHCDQELKQMRRDLLDVVRSIDQEMKDFHGRLIAIEERKLNMYGHEIRLPPNKREETKC